jgi:putative DNA primase/helicase
VVLPDGAAEACALWAVHTYCLDAAENSPRLGITKPTKRCGGSRLMTVLATLVYRPLPTVNLSAASLFRMVEAYHPTLLLDEADSFMDGKEELRGLLNAGFDRAVAYVYRVEGDEHEPRRYSAWAPAVIVRIGRLPDTIEDRVIPIAMKRKAPGEKVEPFRVAKLRAANEPLRRRLARWSADNLDALREADPAMPEGLDDRAADAWAPLLAIADAAGGDWPRRAREVAVELSGGRSEVDNSAAVLLLSDIRDVFDSMRRDRLLTKELLAELHGIEERPWSVWHRGKPMSDRGLARLLDGFGIKSKVERVDDRDGTRGRGYKRAEFENVWSAYLPPGEA